VQPCGASFSIRWAGSADGLVDDVLLTPYIDAIDGFRYIRFEAVLVSNFFTRSRARIDLFEIPFTFE